MSAAEACEAAKSLWPPTAGPEAAVKLAAAEVLLRQPSYKALTVQVASHVTIALGASVSQLGIPKKFEQVLAEDPCFIIEKTAKGSVVQCSASQLVSQASWRQDELQAQQLNHQQQHVPGTSPAQNPAPATAAACSPGLLLRATPRLLQGLEAVWPMQGPGATVETKVKHRAVMQLINTPGHSMRRSVLNSAVKADLGTASIWDLGCKQTLSQLLRQEPGVFVLGPGPRQLPEDPTVSLDAQGVLKTFVHQQYHTPPRAQQLQQQQLDAQQPPAAAAAAAGQQQQPRNPALSSYTTNGVNGAVGVSSSSSRQLNRHPAAQPHAPAAAAAAGGGGGRFGGEVSVSALLQHVSSRVWDVANEQCDLARRELAVRIVKDANPVEEAADQPANTDASAYTLNYAKAGILINKAVKAAYGQPCFPKAPQFFEGHPLFTTLPSQGTAQKHVQLNLPLLLQELTRPAGAEAPVAVRASVLLQRVSSRVWDSSSPQLDMARRTLAYFLVHKANPRLAEDPAAGDLPANPDGEAYTDTYANAGHWINQALKQHFTPEQQLQAYKKLSEVFQARYWVTLPPRAPGGHKLVQLNIAALLQPEAGAAAAVPPGLLSPARTAAAGSSGSRGAGMGLTQVATDVPAAAAAARPGSAGPGSSIDKVRVVVSPGASLGAGGGGGDAAAAEAALAAIQAAAKSLMPPPVSSPVTRLAAQPAAYTPAAAAAVPDSNSVGSSAPAAPATPAVTTADAGGAGSGLSSPAAAAAAAGSAAAAARPDLFHLPPWLAAARAKEEAQQQQQGLSISSSGGPAAAVMGSHQQQGATSLATADTAADAAAEGISAAVPLLYEVVLSNAVPGWYAATYTPWDSSCTVDNKTATGVACSISSGSTSTSSSSSSPGSSKAASETAEEATAGAAGAAAANDGDDGDDKEEEAAGVGSDAGAAGVADDGLQAVSGAGDDRDSADGAAAEDTGGEVVAPAAEPETAAAASSEASGPEADSASTAAGALAAEGVTQQPPAAAAAAAAGCVPAEDIAALLRAVPPRLHSELQPCLCTSSPTQQQQQQVHITHILMDRGGPVTLRLSNRTAVRLDMRLSLGEALQHLAAAQQQDVLANGSSSNHNSGEGKAGNDGSNATALHVNGKETVLGPSAAAAVGQSGVDVQAAACTLFGRDLSRCLGIPRTCHRVCAVPDAVGMLAGLSFCLEPPATASGAGAAAAAAGAASLSDVLSSMKASLLSHSFGRPRSLLVLGRPGVNVVCLLRDICRLLSSSPEQGGLGLHVMLSDTTGRIAGTAGDPSPAIGSTRCLPVFNTTDRAAQAQLLQRAAQHYLPDVLVVGQLGTQEEVETAVQIARSQQLLLVAAAPAGSLQTLLRDSTLCQLVGCTHVPNSSSSTGQPLLQRARQAPFAAAVEVLGEDRLCLHPDVQASIDGLMAHLNSSSGSSKQRQGPVGAHAQLRSRGAGGRLLVEFGSSAAAGAALADAAAVAEAVALEDGQTG